MMKIKRIFIDGFGHFHDVSLENLPGGLVLISGDNEAGKSTLLGFIRAILFGFPSSRGNENLYQPLAGGQHGGRISVLTENQGEIIIERMAGKGRGPVDLFFKSTETRGSEAELKHLLRGFNRIIYKNIYAFSLEELQTFASLNAEDVRGALYGAGAGASLMAIPASMKKLDKKLEGLYKSRGSTPPINKKLAELEETRKKLVTASRQINTYEDLIRSLQDAHRQIEGLEKEEKLYRSKQRSIENYLELWDQWILLQETEAELDTLPVVVSTFPDNGLIRLNNITEKLENAGKLLEKKENDLAALKTKKEALVIDELLIARELEITSIKDNLKMYTANREEIPTLRNSLTQKDKDLLRELANLGSNWTEKRVSTIDRSLFTQDASEDHRKCLQAAESRLEKTGDSLSRAREEYKTSREKEEVINKQLQQVRALEPQIDKRLISAISNGKQHFFSLSRELPNSRKELETELDAMENSIKEIDPRWDSANVENFDCSLPAREKIQVFEEQFSKIKIQVFEQEKKLEFQESNLENARNELNITLDKYRAIPEPSLKTKDDFIAGKKRIKAVRANLDEQKLVKENLSHQKERLADKQNLLQKTINRRIKGLTALLLLAGILIIVIGGAVLGRIVAGGITGGIFILFALLLMFDFRDKRLFRDLLKKPLQDETGEIEKIEKEVARKKQQLIDLETQFETGIEALGLPGPKETLDLDRIEDLLEAEKGNFDEKNRLKEDLDKTRDKKTGIEKTMAEITENLKSSKETLNRLNLQWEKDLGNLSLNPKMKPGTVNLIFSKIEGIKNRMRQIDTLEERIKGMESDSREYCGLFERIPELSGKINIESNKSLSIIDQFLEKNKNAEELRQKRILIAQKLTEQEEERKILGKKLKETEQRYQEAIDQLEKERDEWQAWLYKSGLDPGISPETALKALITINTCVQLIDAKIELEKSIKKKESQVEDYLASVNALFAALARPEPSPDSLSSGIKLLYDEMNKSKLSLEQRKNFEDQSLNTLGEIKTHKKEIENQKKAIQQLLHEGGAQDEEDFRTREALFKKREELLTKKEKSGREMKLISGISSIDELKQVLGRYSKEYLENENREMQKELQELNGNLSSLRDAAAKSKANLDLLTTSEEISRLRARDEKLKEEIRVSAKIWGVNAIARYLVIKARERFEKDRQPKVIKKASVFFTKFTGGEYKEIIAPLGEQSIEVMTCKGKRKKPEQLSRASAEQLFLALRFGYMTNYAESSGGLPVIMDDILVNFDPARVQHTVEIILELSETHQVLFFTCHPEVLEVFKRQKADVPVYYIKDRGFILNPPPQPAG